MDPTKAQPKVPVLEDDVAMSIESEHVDIVAVSNNSIMDIFKKRSLQNHIVKQNNQQEDIVMSTVHMQSRQVIEMARSEQVESTD